MHSSMGVFHVFLNCANGAKSHKASQRKSEHQKKKLRKPLGEMQAKKKPKKR